MSKATNATPAKPRPCGACGEGVFQPADVRGRRFSHRDERNLEIAESLTLSVCTHCGEIRLNDADIERLDEVLERTYVQRRQARTKKLLEQLLNAGWRQSEIERTLGISPGYVSKLLREEKMLATSTYHHLIHVAKHPAQVIHDLAEEYPEFVELESHLSRRGVLQHA